ncbi:MAG TPA: hypothetical protein DCZ97_06835 [Syntrophus sp. (in: bacteria)]|nr:MAG: hypothetical protein A2X92_00675 [Syntrophus sp. GWC2_56_31]HBB16722.1 hypothetical protein [Syntrophus sp. (in: bacteria)]
MTGSASRKPRPMGGELQKGSEIMMKIFRPLSLLLVLIFIAGCAAKIPHALVPDFGKKGVRLIAVMPVKNVSSDVKSGAMLRAKLFDELYFKGYPRIPLRLIDERLAGVSSGSEVAVSPQAVGEILKVDAALYTTLHESQRGSGVLYASTVAEAEFELRSTKTGEILWRVRHREVYRNYGFSSHNIELKSSMVYEQAIGDCVNKALDTLPDSPDTSGN